MHPGLCEGHGEAAAGPARESLPHGVHRGDVGARRQERGVELGQVVLAEALTSGAGAAARLVPPPETSTMT